MIRAARRHEIPLLPQIENAARALGHQALCLTTYRGAPWNEPFYRRRGVLPPALRRVLLTEISHGHPSWRRAIMTRRVLQPAP